MSPTAPGYSPSSPNVDLLMSPYVITSHAASLAHDLASVLRHTQDYHHHPVARKSRPGAMPSRHMTRYHADQLPQTPVVTAPKHGAQVPATANATCKSPPPTNGCKDDGDNTRHRRRQPRKDQDSDSDNTTASNTGNTDDDLTTRVNRSLGHWPGLFKKSPKAFSGPVYLSLLRTSQNPTANRGKLRHSAVCVAHEAIQTRRHPSFTIPITLLPPITTATCLVRARKGSRWPQNYNNRALTLAPQTDDRSHDVSTLATVLSTPAIPIPNNRAITSSGTLLENVRLIHESNRCMSKGRLRLHYPRATCEPYSTPPPGWHKTLDARSGNAGVGPIHLGRWPTPVALWAPTGYICIGRPNGVACGSEMTRTCLLMAMEYALLTTSWRISQSIHLHPLDPSSTSNLGPSDQEPETIPTNAVNATTAFGNARRLMQRKPCDRRLFATTRVDVPDLFLD
ncbi:hypothetical protein EDB83DRAFT_2322283 [Lactarius deliciosus]|nr:hypothetical protein EDB83DRAFT_2322283 [Lactarius deliciosus]